jgi:hypothetical protein
MGPGIKLVKDDIPKLLEAVRVMSMTRVAVGVPADKALRKPDEGEKGAPANNAMLAYIHENGAPEAGIPPRPFLGVTVEAMKAEIAARLRAASIDALKGRKDAVIRAFHALGLRVSTAVKLKINTGPFEPLKERTLAARRARGRMGDKPLIDTGQLRNAITYVVKSVRGVSQFWY